MRRLSYVCLFAFCLFFIVSQVSSAVAVLRVDEAKIKMSLLKESAEVILPVDNSSVQTYKAVITIELLAPGGSLAASAAQRVELKPNTNTVAVPLNLSYEKLEYTKQQEILWYRLHYRITFESSNENTVEGIVSLSQLLTNFFELQINAPRKIQAGSSVRFVARTTSPLSSRPIANIPVNARLEFYDEEKLKPMNANATTNADGYALLDFVLPRDLADEDEVKLKVTAKRGEFEQKIDEDIDVDKRANIFISTDKTLYQPGQTLHVRALVFDNGNRAITNQTLNLVIKDHEYSTVHRDTLETSRFGVVSADWEIPNDVRLGDYTIGLEMEGDNYDDSEANYQIKISRYDLPNFIVNTKTDKPYYTPGQTAAEAEIRADYLFGQPVKRGHVRVVREKERKWNYEAQKYEIDEGETYEGNTDEQGRFIAKLNLKAEFESLSKDEDEKFHDIRYAAYFTDPTTNQTEQRRFDVRVTKYPIHVYIPYMDYRQNKNLPFDFFVTTYYADGTPVSCDVTINEELPDTNSEYEDDKILRPLQTVKTNRFGVAKVTGLKPTGMGEGEDYDGDKVQLVVNVKDAQGQSGQHRESTYFHEKQFVQVRTGKTLHRDGEAIGAKITSTIQNETVVVAVVSEDKVLRTQTAQLKNGQANLLIPYNADFTGLLSVIAYIPQSESISYDYDDVPVGTANVLYPRNQELKTNVRMSQAQYKPGDDAVVNFDVRNPNGKPAETALGIVVFDKAVEERARSDAEFGPQFGFYTAMRKLLRDDGEVAGYSLRDLYKIDMSKPLPEGLDVLAELLVGTTHYNPNVFTDDYFESNYAKVFSPYLDIQFSSFKQTLEAKYDASGVYPTDEEQLQRILYSANISLRELIDPWGTPYRYSFQTAGNQKELNVMSAGPDKLFDTYDDFSANSFSRPYFQQTGDAINRAIERYHARTGDYIRNETTLKQELKREGIDFDSLQDPWGKLYRFNFYPYAMNFVTNVESSGPNGKFESDEAKNTDDVTVWTYEFKYFVMNKARIETALISEYQNTNRFPQNETELKEILKTRGVDFNSMRDPWEQNYYATFKTDSRRSDRATTVNYIIYGETKAQDKTTIVPVTQQVQTITIRSKGSDKHIGTADDFNMAYYSRIVSEQSAEEPKPQLTNSLPTATGQVGGIAGKVVDPNGAVVAGATVKAKRITTNQEFKTETNGDGEYVFRNLPVGIYEVRFESPGFALTVVSQVLVKRNAITSLNVTLVVAGASASVDVSGDAPNLVNTENATVGTTINNTSGAVIPAPVNQIATPRLREYFPETLVWQPSVETDKQGHAKINFKLADNITTWKMSVVSSTEDGKIGVEEKEFLSFLPFFAEHDPPKILTEGDEISLPVVLRNYTEQTQSVDVEMKPETWFSFLGPQKQKAEVSKNDSKNAVFSFRTIASVDKGKQRVTARATTESDAIEKSVTVHPDGEEKSIVGGDVFTNQVSFDVNLPNDTIKNSPRAQVKIYPNLMAHVAESIEGILHRPYGCGEQTISSTYPNVIILRTNKNGGKVSGRVLEQARKYSKEGYKRLLNYRADDGGFTYWGRGEADVALTAYAVRFLNDAKDAIDVDEDVITKAREWLIRKQNADGSWSNYNNNTDSTEPAKRQRAILTAYIARVLATSMEKSVPTTNGSSNENQTMTPAFALKKAVSFLRPMVDAFDEPYLLASYALAAIEAKETIEANRVIAKLETLSKEEGTGVYWSLESNTPFYGWGLAGRIETTAIVLQALTRSNNRNNTLINRGLLFLLKNKDRYGVWYSTQATINVLDALITFLKSDERAPRNNAANKADIYVDGKFVSSIALPAENELVDPLTVDLSNFIMSGNNKIEIRREGANATPASAQVVVNYYIPWDSRDSEAVKRTSSGLLRLSVNYDKPQAEITETITCNVEAERISYRGYGMMLAEIGLPPGADVDRQSLENAMQESGWYFSRYDILPDKVVAYLWPSAGGVKFSFKFKPRYGIKAQTTSSQLYDYYNPEARVVIAPTKFTVK